MRAPTFLLLIPASAAIAAASGPSALGGVHSGFWEISGAPGSSSALRQCVADVAQFAQYEHRGRACSRTIVSDGPASTVIDYNCGAAGFGHTQIDVITPRSLRISTQGISDQLPFNYVLEARRVGDCPKPPIMSRH